MIHLALEVLAFLFLCWAGLIVLGIVVATLGAITDGLGKLSAPYRPPSSKTPSSKTLFALGRDPIEPSHDPRTCPLCLGGGHPSTVRENQEERERQIEAIQRDFSSSLNASTPGELERARKALHDADLYGRAPRGMSQLALEKERKRLAEEKREQEAREYLTRESERVLREREEREMWHIPQEPAAKPLSSAPLIIVRPSSQEAEAELCKCGYPGCVGHEVVKGQIIFPGFTSEAAMAQSPQELVSLNVEVTGVPGNPSEGTIPATTIRARREPRN